MTLNELMLFSLLLVIFAPIIFGWIEEQHDNPLNPSSELRKRAGGQS